MRLHAASARRGSATPSTSRPSNWIALRKGGVVAINAIHLDRMPSFDYDSLLWGERQIRSVTNATRADARDFLALAAAERIVAETTEFSLSDAMAALEAVRGDKLNGAAVIRP